MGSAHEARHQGFVQGVEGHSGWTLTPSSELLCSLLQQPPALCDQLGVRHKSLGATLTTHPRACGVTLTFPASHSGEKDEPLSPFCSSLVLEKHLLVPADSCLLPLQAELAKRWLWWQCSLLNSSCQKILPRPHTQEQ